MFVVKQVEVVVAAAVVVVVVVVVVEEWLVIHKHIPARGPGALGWSGGGIAPLTSLPSTVCNAHCAHCAFVCKILTLIVGLQCRLH